jgi:hypothetical protein
MTKQIKILLSVFMLFALSGCGIYSFTGMNLSPDIKTFSVKYFPNNAALVQPTLSSKFTNALRDVFNSKTNLSLVASNADLELDGEITGYSTEPVAITGDQKAAMQRLKITVNVRCTNKKEPNKSFEQSFNHYADYDASKQLSEVESALIDEINEYLVDQIFTKVAVDW